MQAQWLCCLAAMAFSTGSLAMAEPPENALQLSCGDSRIDHDTEAKLLNQAPLGAKRLSAHVLEVKFAHGARKFVDKPPYDGPLDGINWYYCGYNAGLHIHLIGENKIDQFTGKLLLDDDGEIIEAGKAILISPDKETFLAIEQSDGMDGETWSVRDFHGKAMWSGYAGILRRSDPQHADIVYAQFIHPRWKPESLLIADVACWGDDRVDAQISLGTTKSGLNWFPAPNCEPLRR
jgi:hypothetical protein